MRVLRVENGGVSVGGRELAGPGGVLWVDLVTVPTGMFAVFRAKRWL